MQNALDFASYSRYGLTEILCTCDRTDLLYRPSLLTLDTEICDGKCSCPVVRSHADVKHAQIRLLSAACVRIYSTNISGLGIIPPARIVSYDGPI